MKVTAFNIKYKNNTSYLTITGCKALEAFVNTGKVGFYNADTAPTELEVEVIIPKAINVLNLDFDSLHNQVKKFLEEDTGLEVIDFSMKF